MTKRTFMKILIALVALGVVLTIAHLIYIINAYHNCSIIYFIAEELW